MYINDYSRWSFAFYLPEQLIRNSIPRNLKIQAPDVDPLFVNKDSVIPPDWKMHMLKNVLEKKNFHLEYLTYMTEEYKDLEGDKE